MLNQKDVDEVLDEAQVSADDYEDQVLPEAPTSMTLRVWIDGYGVMITARDNKMKSLLKKTETLVMYAKSHNWQPTWEKATVGQPVTPQPLSDISAKHKPTCPVHGDTCEWKEGISKATGKKYAFWGCTEKNADGSFCKAKLTL